MKYNELSKETRVFIRLHDSGMLKSIDEELYKKYDHQIDVYKKMGLFESINFMMLKYWKLL